MARFLHSGDWQLGMKRRYLGEDAQARFDEARFDAIRRIGAIADDAGCEFVVVCGDVFESNAVDRRTVARALEALSAVPVPVYLLPGNHDPLDGASVLRSAAFRDRAPAHVHVLGDSVPVPIVPGVEIVGAPWSSKRPGRDLVAEACAGLSPDASVTRIAVAHGAVDALSPDRDDPARIRLADAEAALDDGRLQYLALGDRHSRTAIGRTGRIHYAGAPEPTDFDEIDPGQVLVVDVDREHVDVEPRRVATWRFERRSGTPLAGSDDLAQLEAWIDERPDKACTILRLDYRGSLDLRDAARLEALLDDARDLFGCLDVREEDCDLAIVPEDADFADLDLSGFAERAAERLRADAASGVGAARDALALLVRLAGGSGGRRTGSTP